MTVTGEDESVGEHSVNVTVLPGEHKHRPAATVTLVHCIMQSLCESGLYLCVLSRVRATLVNLMANESHIRTSYVCVQCSAYRAYVHVCFIRTYSNTVHCT